MIYFIEGQGTGLIKIGFTQSRPDERLLEMQTGSPVKLLRVALMAGSLEDETNLHFDFMDLWSHGEWFRDDPRIRSFIAESAVTWTGGEHVQFLTPGERHAIEASTGEGPAPRPEPTLAELALAADLRAAVLIVRPSLPEPLRPLEGVRWNSSDLMRARAKRRAKT